MRFYFTWIRAVECDSVSGRCLAEIVAAERRRVPGLEVSSITI